MIDLVRSYIRLRKFESSYKELANLFVSRLIKGEHIVSDDFKEIQDIDSKEMLIELFLHHIPLHQNQFDDKDCYYYIDKEDKEFPNCIKKHINKQIDIHKEKWYESHLKQIQAFYFFLAAFVLILSLSKKICENIAWIIRSITPQ